MAICFKNIQMRLPRFAVKLIASYLVSKIGFKEFEIAGSYKRGRFWCNDVDLLVKNSNLTTDILDQKMFQLGWKLNCLRNNHQTASRQYLKRLFNKIVVVDIFLCDDSNYGNMSLFTTGSKQYNDTIRKKLATLGYSWKNPAYFYNLASGEKVYFKNEKDALNFIDLPYVAIKKRS